MPVPLPGVDFLSSDACTRPMLCERGPSAVTVYICAGNQGLAGDLGPRRESAGGGGVEPAFMLQDLMTAGSPAAEVTVRCRQRNRPAAKPVLQQWMRESRQLATAAS